MCKICTPKFVVNPLVRQAAGIKGRFWKTGSTITIKFMDGTAAQHKVVKETAAQWLKYANLKFQYVATNQPADVRISFEDYGAWSYIGRDALLIDQSKPTMNLQWLDAGTILHEFGHMLGLIHEHQNPMGGINWNKPVVYEELMGAPNYWDRQTVDINMFHRLSIDLLRASTVDPLSIMMYAIPARWTTDGFYTGWNEELSETDKSFIGGVYPFEDVRLDYAAFCRNVYRNRKDINRMYEHTVVLIGRQLGLPTDTAKKKRENVRIVSDFLFSSN